ncbi:hypothetical protein AAHC03_016732 [Spirometra sp. Aus1]
MPKSCAVEEAAMWRTSLQDRRNRKLRRPPWDRSSSRSPKPFTTLNPRFLCRYPDQTAEFYSLKNMKLLTEYFSRPSATCEEAIQLPSPNGDSDHQHSLRWAVNMAERATSEKAPDAERLPAEANKHGGQQLLDGLSSLLRELPREECLATLDRLSARRIE